MKKPTIADVLHRAADEFLACTQRQYDSDAKQKFSCCAITMSLRQMVNEELIDYEEMTELDNRIREGLKNMGLNNISVFQFENNLPGRILAKQQSARYNWLKFAAMIAEEQGV